MCHVEVTPPAADKTRDDDARGPGSEGSLTSQVEAVIDFSFLTALPDCIAGQRPLAARSGVDVQGAVRGMGYEAHACGAPSSRQYI